MCYKDSTLWYEKDGKIDYSYSGICSDVDKNIRKLYYVKNGKEDFSYTGLAEYDGNWYYIKMVNWMIHIQIYMNTMEHIGML